jgi:hypothetical protein
MLNAVILSTKSGADYSAKKQAAIENVVGVKWSSEIHRK